MIRAFHIALLALALISPPALAQTAPPPNIAQDIGADWQVSSFAQRHLAEDVNRLIQENASLKAEIEKLKSPPPAAKPATP